MSVLSPSNVETSKWFHIQKLKINNTLHTINYKHMLEIIWDDNIQTT